MPLRGGAAKAKRSFVKQYGKRLGTKYFWMTANKRGKGKTRDAKARNAFKKRRR